MKKHPPHLPKKDTAPYTGRTALMLVVLSSLIAFLSGLAAAFSVAAWFMPISSSDILYIGGRGVERADTTTQVDHLVVRQVRYRLLSVYDTARAVSGWYSESALVGHAIVLSSDGWSVLYDPAFRKGQERGWAAADFQGALLRAEASVFDERNGLVYVKWGGADLRVTLFGRAEDAQKGAVLWAVNGSWESLEVGETKTIADSSMYPTREYSRASLSGAGRAGDVLVNSRGDLVGFVDISGRLLPAWWVEYKLPRILENGKVDFVDVPWRGFFVDARHEGGMRQERLGFFVSRLDRIVKNGPRVGDVVVAVAGQPVVKDALYRQVLSAVEGATMTVVRGDEEVEVSIR